MRAPMNSWQQVGTSRLDADGVQSCSDKIQHPTADIFPSVGKRDVWGFASFVSGRTENGSQPQPFVFVCST